MTKNFEFYLIDFASYSKLSGGVDEEESNAECNGKDGDERWKVTFSR